MLSEGKNSMAQSKQRHLIGYDLDDKVEVKSYESIKTKAIIVKLEKR